MSGDTALAGRVAAIACCPDCRGALAAADTGAALRCGACAREFPLEGGVARLLPRDLPAAARRTAACFGFEWRTLGDALHRPDAAGPRSPAKLLDACGLPAAAFAGRLVLDAGCGNGGYSAAFAALGAEVVGVDLTPDGPAVAWRRVADPRALFLQGDLLTLPLASGRFDVVFSLGVLHHTVDPPAALRRCAEALRPGGILIAGVYSPVPVLGPLYALLRAVATCLPLRVLWALSWIGAPLGAVPLLGRICCPWMSPRMPWRERWLDTFDWYAAPVQSYHTLDEVRCWFEATGLLCDIEVASRPFGTLRAVRTADPA